MQIQARLGCVHGEMSESKNRSDLQAVVPSAKARSLLWHAFSLDTAYLETADDHEPFEKPGAHLFWVLSGHGTLETDGNKYLLQPGKSVWFVDMTRVRTYAPTAGQQLVKRGIRFGGPGLDNWHKELGGSKQAQFEPTNPAPLHKAFRDLWRTCQRKRPGWEWQVHVVITNILGRLLMSRSLLDSPHVELPAPVLRVLNAIAANPFRDWRAKELATVAKVSYSGLRALFRSTGQGTIHQQIQRARLDQARLLLADERLSVKDVAAQLNFSSEFYFSHFFRHGAGMSPSEFRQHLKA